MNAEAKAALEKIGVTDIEPSDITAKYNMEQRKLIEIAKVMAHDPEMFIVDETTTALSEKGREILYHLMHQAAAELNFEEAARLRDEMIELKKMLLELEG